MASILDEAIAHKDKEEKLAEKMQHSMRLKNHQTPLDIHIFDNEIRKMPDDTHNKVAVTHPASLQVEVRLWLV